MVFGKHINRYYLKYAPLLLLGLFSLVTVDYLQLLIPNMYQMIVNGINTGYVTVGGENYVFDLTFAAQRIFFPMLGIILAIVFGRFLWRVMFFGSAIRVENALRLRMFDNAKDLSRQYYQVNKVGSLMSLFTNDLDTVQECFGWGIMMFFDALLLGTMSITKMWRMNPTLAMLSLIPTVLLFVCASVVGSSMMKKWDIRQEAFSRLSDFSQESFSGIAVVKAFVKEAKELLAFKKLNAENEKANVEHTKASVLLRVLVTLFVESVIAIILGYGGYLVHEKVFDPGQMVEFIGYFTAMIWPVMAISELIDMTSRGRASLKRIGALIDAPKDVKDSPDAHDLKDVKGKIEFRDLTFRYPDGEFDVLNGVTFTIEAGENVGLVGKTGSGKTTVADLILRTYNAPDGTVFIDGQDINTITLKSLRDACAYVPQDNFLFSDTITNNIGFYSDEPDIALVRKAAELSDVAENIDGFKDGFETVLGERGVTVSGGQKQRISIARALMKNSPILIMDDSVSAVDTKTEKTILENLKKTRKNKTTILISHRISTVRDMDKIIFLDDNRVLAAGTHDELYASCEEYKRTVDLQKLEEEEKNND